MVSDSEKKYIYDQFRISDFDCDIYYRTANGICINADSKELLSKFADDSIDLIITSPPFALQRKKEYGNENQNQYVDWFLEFAKIAKAKLKDTGSFVVDLGGAYCKGRPVRSLYQYRLLIRMVDELGYNLAEEFFWYNPSKLPSPIEWVNKRKIRVKDSVNTNWWFSKTDNPKADVKKVLNPYSDSMKKLLNSNGKYYKPKYRPSGYDISDKFNINNGGAIPSNLLQIPNSDSSSPYLQFCNELGIKSHPARFPVSLPEFYIKYLTDPGDIVVDIFAGSNTTGYAAEQLGRRWVSIELSPQYVSSSILRFYPNVEDAKNNYELLMQGESVVIPG